MRKQNCKLAAILCGLLILLGTKPKQTLAQTIRLDDAELHAAGIQVPAYLSLAELAQSQKEGKASYLVVSLDSMHGSTVPVSPEQGRILGNATFTLEKIDRHLPYPPGAFNPDLADDILVIAGVTEAGELRALKTMLDPRGSYSEGLVNGKMNRREWVMPKVKFVFELPDDPAIRRCEFFYVDGRRGISNHLTHIGTLAIPKEQGQAQ